MSTEYILRDGNFYRRDLVEGLIGSADVLLSGLVEPAPLQAPCLFQLGTSKIHAAFASTYTALSCRLHSLPFRASMELTGDDSKLVHVPTNDYFNEGYKTKTSFVVKDKFYAPASCYYSFTLRMIPQHNLAAQSSECYIVMHTSSGEYAPHWPNVYDNGRVCMGYEWDDHKNKGSQTVIERFINSYDSFHSTVSSSHLFAGNLKLFNRKLNEDGSTSWNPPTGLTHNNYGTLTSLAFMPMLRTALEAHKQ